MKLRSSNSTCLLPARLKRSWPCVGSLLDYGGSNTPKLGVKWKLYKRGLPQLFGEGFRAPSLTEISRSSVTAFTTVIDPLYRRRRSGMRDEHRGATGKREPPGTPKPRTSRHAGIVWDITPEASVSALMRSTSAASRKSPRWTLIRYYNEVATTGVYANRVIRGPVLPGEQFGPIQAISVRSSTVVRADKAT